jgi:hypothetical protein
MTDPLLMFGLGLCTLAIIAVTAWLAWPLIRRVTSDDPY